MCQKKEFEEPPVLNQELKSEVFKLPIELEQQVICQYFMRH
ncbi:hypothetical protein PJV92_10340 [Aliarcobacter butzleri]|uniref:Uncharacterized protein n=1 Tax=Aliarcobacter butzleri TaxID=28197 RepID=A0AAP4Q084_9BACT|nr:hypothetical protein [Aliarcobacter butzleri]MCT7572789.1 hypothetical protein [Aliarcobacter butzleri]MCT7586439.1 hypothetical protein [Aliarcobacter butzleri]MCT7595884.1 hypothetical protein [Aliarcobacter butzleri]MCT7600411.1 hypothetical protein [Aliarcobacter butzleri]MDN5052839.1 hypothetical protein [Aliarcobacter butzleri]